MSEYAERDLNDCYDTYAMHIDAMTREGLFSKSAIAAELTYRDVLISQLQDKLKHSEGEVERYKVFIDYLYRETSRYHELWDTDGICIELKKLKESK